jgi:5-methylcytosine-specific restriction endonuclease McrA
MSILSDDQPCTKPCSKCGVEFAATPENFYREKGGKDGLRADCKACVRKREGEYRQEHLEEFAEYQRQYRADHLEEMRAYDRERYKKRRPRVLRYIHQYYQDNKAQILAKNKQYYEKHKEEIEASRKRRYGKNRIIILFQKKQYSQEHPEVSRNSRRRRRAHVRNAEGTHTDAEVQLLYDWQQGLCCYCSQPVKNKLIEPVGTQGVFAEEHIVPLCRDRATDWIWNIVLSCPSCNWTKHKKMALLEWQPPNLLPYMRVYLEDALKQQGYELDRKG